MKSYKIFLPFFILIVFAFSRHILATDWEIYKSDHFSMYYKEDLSFAQRVASKAEECYRRIDRSIGFTRFGKFWTFDNRCEIYLYTDQESYLANSFPEDRDKALLSYGISHSIANFLRSKGQYRFTNLCRALRDGRNFEQALISSYQFDFGSLDRLDKKWQKYIRK